MYLVLLLSQCYPFPVTSKQGWVLP